jgi:N-hydroxyarylamine O-acetyltransferase
MPPRLDTAAYLRRLGILDPGPPTAAGLRALHVAHVERIPYEAIEIQLGRPTTVDPHESATPSAIPRVSWCGTAPGGSLP